MAAWKTLFEFVRTLTEAQYRGQSDVRLTDLQKLGDEIGIDMDPEGGTARVEHHFNPTIWTGWQMTPGPALAIATTDTKRTVQTGNPQGGTVHKTNWGGKVVNVAAPIRPHHNDRMGTTVDRYDVVMVGDITSRTNAKGKEVQDGVLRRIAWSPAVGSSEQRRARLEALMTGKPVPPLSRRPQPELPNPPEGSGSAPEPQNVPRVGQNIKPTPDDDQVKPKTGSGGQASSDFKRRLAAISAKYYGKQQAPDIDDDGET